LAMTRVDTTLDNANEYHYQGYENNSQWHFRCGYPS
jgi:hypothetical protein